MTTISSIAGEISRAFDMDPDEALTFAITCAGYRGIETGTQESGQAQLVEIDEDTAQEIWEDAAVATEFWTE
ncbi:hypothetical protein [Streptomyces sp. NPDC058694]|uniref:hypothetical protein n=1 Tax=Streptomyces sp. NPDC058694 TaxID=3346603 RepID=UPI0036538B6C